MDDLIEFLCAKLDEREAWARAANRPYEYADEGAVAPDTGVHWCWVTGENWDVVTPDPAVMQFVEGPDGSWAANLATVEEWPVTYRLDDGTIIRESAMPRTYANSIEEMDPAAAGHIIRHDPAWVLADIDSKRRIIVYCAQAIEIGTPPPGSTWSDDAAGAEVAVKILRLLAGPFVDDPGFRSEWLDG